MLLDKGLQPKNTVLTEREILLTTIIVIVNSNKRSTGDDGDTCAEGNENINEQLMVLSLKINWKSVFFLSELNNSIVK